MNQAVTLPQSAIKTVSCDCQGCNKRAIGFFTTKSGSQNLCSSHFIETDAAGLVTSLVIYDKRAYELAVAPPWERCVR